MQTPMTMFRMELNTRFEKSSEDWIEIFIQPCPRRYSLRMSFTRPGISCPFLPARISSRISCSVSLRRSRFLIISSLILVAAISSMLMSGAMSERTPCTWVRPRQSMVTPWGRRMRFSFMMSIRTCTTSGTLTEPMDMEPYSMRNSLRSE